MSNFRKFRDITSQFTNVVNTRPLDAPAYSATGGQPCASTVSTLDGFRTGIPEDRANNNNYQYQFHDTQRNPQLAMNCFGACQSHQGYVRAPNEQGYLSENDIHAYHHLSFTNYGGPSNANASSIDAGMFTVSPDGEPSAQSLTHDRQHGYSNSYRVSHPDSYDYRRNLPGTYTTGTSTNHHHHLQPEMDGENCEQFRNRPFFSAGNLPMYFQQNSTPRRELCLSSCMYDRATDSNNRFCRSTEPTKCWPSGSCYVWNPSTI